MADFSRLPGPNADLWDWQLLAACRGVDSSLFFHPEGERGAARSSREEAAKEVCMRCPVRSECATHALSVREPYGVWGGLTEDEREELLGRARRSDLVHSGGAARGGAHDPAHGASSGAVNTADDGGARVRPSSGSAWDDPAGSGGFGDLEDEPL